MPRRSIFGEAKVRKVECRSKRQLDYAETKRKNNLRPLRRAGRSLRPRRPADDVLRRLRPATYRINNTVESPFPAFGSDPKQQKIGHGENGGILRSSMLNGHESVHRCGAKHPPPAADEKQRYERPNARPHECSDNATGGLPSWKPSGRSCDRIADEAATGRIGLLFAHQDFENLDGGRSDRRTGA